MKNKQNAVEEIERALLGLILIDKKVINNVRGYLNSKDFFNKRNAMLFQVMLDLHEEGYEIELSVLIERLEQEKQLISIGNVDYIHQLMNEAGLVSNVNKYIKTIVDKSQLRSVKKIILDLENEVDKPNAKPEEISEILERKITETTRDIEQKKFQTANDVVTKSLRELRAKVNHKGVSGIASGFYNLDEITSGFQKGDLIIIAARPSMGKTAFALNIAKRASLEHKIALFSLEMPASQLFNRMISFSAFVSGSKLREPSKMSSEEWNKVNTISEKQISKLKLYTDDSAGIKLSELVWKVRRLHKNVGVDMIIIDYLQLLSIGNYQSENRQAEVSRISRTLKQLARELNIPVIALSQLSRRVEQRENKRPMMSDLRESGAIEQDADIVAFLYRDAYYNKDTSESESSNQITDIIISKHRNGPTGNIQLTFNPEIGSFSSGQGKK